MIPDRYLATIGPLDGVRSMLELGNKRGTDGPGDTYKRHFEALGIRHVSVDWNGQDGALALDLREPLKLGNFDVVTNIGTSEHVDEQLPAWRNMVEAADQVIACVVPFPGDWPGHGLWYPRPEFYPELGRLNGFVIEKLDVQGIEGRRLVHARLRRDDRLGPFVMPPRELMTAAPPRKPKPR